MTMIHRKTIYNTCPRAVQEAGATATGRLRCTAIKATTGAASAIQVMRNQVEALNSKTPNKGIFITSGTTSAHFSTFL